MTQPTKENSGDWRYRNRYNIRLISTTTFICGCLMFCFTVLFQLGVQMTGVDKTVVMWLKSIAFIITPISTIFLALYWSPYSK